MVQRKKHKYTGKKKKQTKLKRVTEHTRKKATKKQIQITTSTSSLTSPFAEFFSTSSTSLITVSMVSGPSIAISGSSWHFDLFEMESKTSAFIMNWQTESPAAFTASPDPEPTPSSGRPSPDISASRLTLTMLSYPGSFTESVPIIVNQTSRTNSHNPFSDIDGMSVWTIESYTSSGMTDSTGRYSQLIQVKYPWSPDSNSNINGTSDYPSSVSQIPYFRPSRETLRTVSALSTNTIPNFEQDLGLGAINWSLDYVLIKRSQVPDSYLPIASRF